MTLSQGCSFLSPPSSEISKKCKQCRAGLSPPRRPVRRLCFPRGPALWPLSEDRNKSWCARSSVCEAGLSTLCSHVQSILRFPGE